MSTDTHSRKIYDGDGDALMLEEHVAERIVLAPDSLPTSHPDVSPRIRIQWGQHLLDDLLAGRYRSLICAVNAEDNSHGIIAQLAHLLPTSQWDEKSITSHAKLFAHRETISVIKVDMDTVEVLALLRPKGHDHLTLEALRDGFRVASEMISRKPHRRPVASVSFLGGRANRLLDGKGEEPSFETVLRTMHESGFSGDVYPSPAMWQAAPTALYARYPFPESLEAMRMGGY